MFFLKVLRTDPAVQTTEVVIKTVHRLDKRLSALVGRDTPIHLIGVDVRMLTNVSNSASVINSVRILKVVIVVTAQRVM